VLLGVVLRVYQISLQIPADDEWHSLHALLTHRFLYLATHLGDADYCIPLTLFLRVSYLVYGLSESIVGVAVLFFGIVFLFVGPWVVRIKLGRAVAAVFAWLLAVSPLLIFYSRYARPYIISTFFCFVAAFAFFRWWTGGGKLWRWIYAVSAISGPYFHLSTLPFVLAPAGFGLAELFTSKRVCSRNWKDLVHVTVLVGIGIVLLLGPALIVDQAAWSEKVVRAEIELSTLQGAAGLLAGTSSLWLIASFLLLAVAGGISLTSGHRRLGLYLLLLIVVQLGANLLIGPAMFQVPIVFVRYSLACVPLVLLFVSVAVRSIEDRVRHLLNVPQGLLAVLLGGLLLWFGPLLQLYYYPNNWTNHGLFQYCYDASDEKFHYRFVTEPRFISKFYRELGTSPPGSLKLLESPWYYAWHHNPFPYYQQIHRQEMMVGFIDDPKHWNRPGEYPPSYSRMRFWSFVHLSQHDRIAALNVDYVVLHKDLALELPATAVRKNVDMTGWISEYRSLYGAPYFEDVAIVVFKTGR